MAIQPPRRPPPRAGRITPKNSEVDRRHRLAAPHLPARVHLDWQPSRRALRAHRQAGHGLDAAASAQPADGARQPQPAGAFLIHDRDAKFSRAIDALLEREDIKVIRTPVRTPNANAYMERWVGSVRRECLDRLLILGRRQLAHVLRVYVQHYNRERPHRALDLKPPDSRIRSPIATVSTPHALQMNRRDLLGGLIHEYELAAA